MDNLERTVIENAERSKSNTHRLDDIEHRIGELAKEHSAIHDLALSVREIALNTQNIQKELTKQGAKIEALERVPADRWNNIVKTIFTAIASALAGGLVSAIIFFMK